MYMYMKNVKMPHSRTHCLTYVASARTALASPHVHVLLQLEHFIHVG